MIVKYVIQSVLNKEYIEERTDLKNILFRKMYVR